MTDVANSIRRSLGGSILEKLSRRIARTLRESKNSLHLRLALVVRRLMYSPFESLARSIWLRYVDARTKSRLYDRMTDKVMDRVLDVDSICIDAGAFKGNILAEMLRRAPEGKLYAFEPIPSLAENLRRKYPSAVFPQVKIYEMALGDDSGRTSFQYVVSNPAYSGLRTREYPRSNETVEVITVEKRRLDDVIPSDERVAFLKIDVEGGELPLLRGAKLLVDRCQPYIVFEHGNRASGAYGATSEDVHLFLSERGMKVSALDDWLTGRRSLGRTEFSRRAASGQDFYFLAHPSETTVNDHPS